MSVEFRGSVDYKLYIQAQRLHARGLGWGAGVWIVASLYMLLTHPLQEPKDWLIPAAMIGAAAVIIFSPHLSARTVMASSKVLTTPLTGTATETTLTMQSELGQSEVPWSKFHAARLGKEVVILYWATNLFQIIGRRFFADDAAWTVFRDLVTRNVPLKKSLSRMGRVLVAVIIIVLLFLAWSLFSVANNP